MRRTIVLFACVALAACGDPELPIPADPGGGGGGGGGGDPTPTNGSIATAATIALDTQVAETRTSVFGDDYFSFVVPAGGRTVRIQTFDSSGTACESPGTEITLYSASQTSLGVSGWPHTCPDATWNLEAGTYYVKVIAYYPGTGTYLLRTTSIVTTAETEQNNFINSADGPFTADTWIRAPLDTTVDRDYFALRNATAAPVTVHLETFVGGIGLCRGGGTDLYVEAADGTVLAFNDNASNDSWCSALDYTIPADTMVYARVANDYVDAITEYLFQIDFP